MLVDLLVFCSSCNAKSSAGSGFNQLVLIDLKDKASCFTSTMIPYSSMATYEAAKSLLVYIFLYLGTLSTQIKKNINLLVDLV